MTLTVDLPDDLERRLRERATCHGRVMEDYVLGLIERDAADSDSGGIEAACGLQSGPDPGLSDSEFEALLDQLAFGPTLPRLPTDFSRADIYADHDCW